jgi:hypothetical protein
MKVTYLKIKGIIAACAAILIMATYVAYNYFYYEEGVKLNELYFISTGIGIATLSGLLFTFFNDRFIKTCLLFCSVFYSILEIAYIWSWVTVSHAYAYIKLALFVGLLIGILYASYDYIRSSSNRTNDSY